MKDIGIVQGNVCSICEASLDHIGYSCLRTACVDPPDGVRSYVQRGTWFCRRDYAWHLRHAHGIGEEEIAKYLDPETEGSET